MNTREVIELFRNSTEKNAQLDILRDNQQVLAQIYRYEDVKRWNIGVDLGNEKGYVIEIMFAKSKTNNSKNKQRFHSSNLIHQFIKFEEIEEGSYFRFINRNTSISDFEMLVYELLNNIYGMDIKFSFRFNIY